MATRRERVVLELQDDFTTGMARAAAATALLDHELDGLSKDAVRSRTALRDTDRDIDHLGNTSKRSSNDLNQFTGRVGLLAEAAAALGPAVVPITAVTIPAISGLTSTLGFAGVALLSSVLAFHGLKDAITAVNKARLDPTVENLQKAHDALQLLPPDTRAFVKELRSFAPVLDQMSAAAASGLFPGLGRGLEDLKTAAPAIEKVIHAITTEVGSIGEDIGKSVKNGDWDQFLAFIGTEGPHALAQMARAAGNLTHGLASLWIATQPMNNDFLGFLVKATDDFDHWAQALDQTQGFQNFLDYVHEIGPEVGDTLSSVGNALVQLTQAIAPLGGPSLRIIKAFADAIAAIADSPIGTPLLGLISTMSALSLITRGYQSIQSATFGSSAWARIKATGNALTTVTTAEDRARLSAIELEAAEAKRSATFRSGIATTGKSALALGALALASSGVADKFGLTNTASLALAGSLAGPWGAAVGGAIGLIDDWTNAVGHLGDAQVAAYKQGILGAAGPNLQAQLDAVNAAIEQQKKLSNAAGPDFTIGSTHFAPFDFSNDWKHADDKLTALKKTQAELTGEVAKATAATEYANSAEGRAAKAAQKHAAALNVARDAARKSGQQFTAFGKDLDDSKVSLDKWIEGLAKQAQALREFAANSVTAARRGLSQGLVNDLRDQGPAGALRLQQLAKGTKDQIDAANKSYREQQQALRGNVKVAQQLQAIADATAAKKYRLKFGVDTDQATAAITALNRLLASLHDRNINIRVNRNTNATLAEADANKAAGGPIVGPGSKTSDSILIAASNGEFMQSAAAVDYYGVGFMDALNKRQVPRFAAGGSVAGTSGHSTFNVPNAIPGESVRHAINRFEEALKGSTKALDKEKAAREALISKRDELASTVRDSLRSDLFNTPTAPSVWMSDAERNTAAVGDVFSILRGDISNAKNYQSALAQLKKKGLRGDAYAAIAGSGNLQEVQALAGLSKSQLSTYASLYATRDQLTASIGAGAGQTAYGAQIAAQTKATEAAAKANREVSRDLKALQALAKKNPHAVGAAVGKAINGAAPKRRP